jgi:hypothetical protein
VAAPCRLRGPHAQRRQPINTNTDSRFQPKRAGSALRTCWITGSYPIFTDSLLRIRPMVTGKIAAIQACWSPATFANVKTRDLKLLEWAGRPSVYRSMVVASLVVPALSTYPRDVMIAAASATATAKNERGQAAGEHWRRPAERHSFRPLRPHSKVAGQPKSRLIADCANVTVEPVFDQPAGD